MSVGGVVLRYGAATALRGVSLQARRGAITCVMGRNGVGKTTLLRAVTGQHPIAAGDIRFDGRSIKGLRAYDRARAGIGLVPQGRDIFPLLSVEENLKTGFAPLRREDRRIPDEVFELFPVLADMLARRGGDLSGGQQQQLAIARALVMRPRLLVLDEPTEGIQPSIIKDIGRALRVLRDAHGLSIILVEQYLDFCRELANHVYVMDRGEIVHEGRAQTLDDPQVARLLHA